MKQEKHPAAGYKLQAVGLSRGVTLIDTLVGTSLMLVIFLGIIAAFNLSVDVVTNNKARAGAIALANERMEYLRSLSYGQVGVTGGIPAGIVPQTESVSFNDTAYTRRTLVWYSDDPKDGLAGADTNGIVADYKTIRVEVSWISRQGQRSIELVGRMSPAGVESPLVGGTLTINVVNAVNAAVANAQVDIANVSTNPTINIRTFTNTEGIVSFIGAPASSGYEISISKSGYNNDQTYAPSVANPNPSPRHLTVVNNQTTSQPFGIDLLSNKTVETYKKYEVSSWADTFTDTTLTSATTSVDIDSGSARLAGEAPYPSDGTIRSVLIATSSLVGWNSLSWVDVKPAQTTVVYRLYDAGGQLVPDAALPGNAAGFSTSPVDLSNVSTSVYPSLTIGATLSTSDPSATPSIASWSVSLDRGPFPLPNFTFHMRGQKPIGNDPAVYKYDADHTTDAASSLTLSNIEWDTYQVTAPISSGYDIASACNPQPEYLTPGTSQTTRLYLLPYSSYSLLADVRSTASNQLIPGATVRLYGTGYDVTQVSDSCGQAFFDNLENAIYTMDVSAAGYVPKTVSNITVSGTVSTSVTLD